MPNRILKESICRSDQINELSLFEEVLFYRLMVNADDYGRFDGRISIIKNTLFPLKDGLRAEQIEKAIKNLSSQELVECYTVAGKPFVRLTGWDRHQAIRAKKSKYPSPEDADKVQTSASICNQMHANVPVIQSESESKSESNANKAAKRGFTAPTPDDVRQFCKDNGITGVDPDRFCDFYTAKGWKVGNSPMKDWHAAVRNWARSDSARAAPRPVRAQQYTQRNYTDNDLSFGDSDLMREAAYG